LVSSSSQGFAPLKRAARQCLHCAVSAFSEVALRGIGSDHHAYTAGRRGDNRVRCGLVDRAQLRAPIAEKLEITVGVLIERADQIFKRAMAAGQSNAAISALKELGVLSGKRVERSERGEPGEFDRMSDEELREAVDAQARELGYVQAGGKLKH
jgi:hypothetical protein